MQAFLINPAKRCITDITLGRHDKLDLIDEMQQLIGCKAVRREILVTGESLYVAENDLYDETLLCFNTCIQRRPLFGKGILLRVAVGAGGSLKSMGGTDHSALKRMLFYYNDILSTRLRVYFQQFEAGCSEAAEISP